MNKIFSKTVKKTTLFSVVLAVALAAAVIIGAIFGFNKDITLKDAKTLTVSVNSFAYESHKEELISDCENLFGDLSANYIIEGEMSGDECELVFVFDKDVDLSGIKTAVADHFAAKTAAGGAWEGSFIDVMAATETVKATTANYYTLRAVIAGAVFALLAFAYVAIRYQKVSLGLVVGANALLGEMLSAALLILTRIPVTSIVAAVIALAGILSAVLATLTVGKVRAAQKENGGVNEQTFVEGTPVKETALLVGGTAAASLLVGILGGTAFAWVATAMLVSLVGVAFLALFFTPAFYLSVKTAADKRPAKDGYVGAKKKEKKAKAAPVEEAATEAPVEEEAVEEAAEAPVEETVEAEEVPAEEAAEEAPVEETEA